MQFLPICVLGARGNSEEGRNHTKTDFILVLEWGL
jgi:hypothetical protein